MLKRFFAYYRPHKGLFLLDFSCAVVSGLLELGFPIAVKIFVDRLLPGQDWGLILLASLGLLAVYLTNTGLMTVVTYWGHMLGINIEFKPRFLRQYLNLHAQVTGAVQQYISDVKNRKFPNEQEQY